MAAKIDKLDDDSLCAIFESLAHLDPPPKQVKGEPTLHWVYGLGWIASTHVCRRWRTLALSMSPLWANFVSSLPHAFPTLLDRARDAPLSIAVDSVVKETALDDIIDCMWKPGHDVRSLRAVFVPGPYCDEFQNILQHKRHNCLTTLDFRVWNVTHPMIDAPSAPHSDRIVVVDAPNLRTAIVSGLQGYITSPDLRSLTMCDNGDILKSTNDLLSMLSCCSRLEILRFHVNLIPFNQRGTSLQAGEGAVALPHLKLFCAWSTLENGRKSGDITSFLRRITIPESCVFHYADVLPEDNTDWRSAIDLCESRLRQSPYDALTICTSLHPGTRDPTSIFNIFSTREWAWPRWHSYPDARRTLCCTTYPSLDWGVMPDGVRLAISGSRRCRTVNILSDLIPRLRHDVITHLTLHSLFDSHGIQHEELSASLKPLSAVKFLHLSFPSSLDQALLDAFTPAYEHDQSLPTDPDMNIILPALYEATIHQEHIVKPLTEPQHLETWWASICTWLAHRIHKQRPLHTLRLTGDWNTVPQGLQTLDEIKLLIVKGLVEEFHDERALPWRE